MKNLIVLTVWALTTSMTGCGEPEAVVDEPPEEPAAEDGAETEPETDPTIASAEVNEADLTANLGVTELECPEGTRPQIGQSATGVEQWCEQDGVMQGPYKGYYADSTRKVGGQYVDNQPDGAWLWWHPNNTKASKGTYSRGKQAGIWTWWHPNGSRAQEGDFLAGRKAGKWTAWQEDGRKKEEGLYHNGNKNGLWTYYRMTGEEGIARTETWQSGVRISTKIMGEEASADAAVVELAPANKPRKSGG